MNMKKYYFVSAIAALALASCANDDFLGEVPGNNPSAVNSKAISFSGEAGKMSRATGSETDATKLGNRFWVYGTKKISETDKLVYNNYLVKYTTKAGTTSSTKTWQYSGLNNSSDKEGENTYNYIPAIDGAYSKEQGLKFWDHSASSYTFTAFSAPSDNLAGEAPKIKVKKETKGNYTITLAANANVDKLYFADKMEISSKDKYNQQVQFTFRNIIAKVRVGMYTTIPGYTVQIKKFYAGENLGTADENKFVASAENTALKLDGSSYTVSYNDKGTPTLDISTAGRAASQSTTLELGSNLLNTNLGTKRDEATYDQSDKSFTCFLPQTANNDMKIKVDYQLTSTDGSGETIDVNGATVTVDKKDINWQINHSYTYIFKISENTNGSTGNDTVGLFPITFDAVVKDLTSANDSHEQEFTKNQSTNGQQ